ncbi:large subunit ribosomal protein L9 [Nannocystis exedens]|uniref:Large ribosomal subunit protein bL9 n=4 Tax=Nannocystis TaxID=53 RepID=A0ABS7TTX7_9BACT|nr:MULTISPECIES: 50S ribosomal protein L9 [Nannocystis]MBZ5711511.1 50S ribosomal protein L9 [Nannocystis pusilla]MCY1058554.1 50S ribosomal protein L9 [Nannocystis sp. SCPEA4]MDC0675118.1 50S ribosomal protein L9 [Nannocystis radixulma]PCC74564.1 50S ribosomal protein L9 [Nannocystis exedens]WAS90144.1 50S ribosomal protein L9 [Nannocystis poenicansa]
MLELILRSDVPGLGRAGEVVKVRPGYGRNYLIPRGLALAATRGNMAQLEHQKRLIAAEQARVLAEHKAMAQKLKGVSVSIARKKGAEGKLFGSVSTKDIAEALANQNITIDRKLIKLDEPFKNIGTYEVPVRFSGDITETIRVNVVGV